MPFPEVLYRKENNRPCDFDEASMPNDLDPMREI